MRILLVNTLLFNHGGPSIYTFNLADMLTDEGHEVEFFGMEHPNNGKFRFSELFPEQIDYPELLRRGAIRNGYKVFSTMLHNKAAEKGIEELLLQWKPDIVHLQNWLHHLTPSIIKPIRKRNIPIIWTLHDSVLVCPNTNLYNDRLKSPCTLCDSQLKRYFLPPLKRCKKSSFAASCAASLEALYFSIFGLRKKIDFFIAPSKFLEGQLKSMGAKLNNVRYVPNYVEDRPYFENSADYYVFLGRLVEEKGIHTLLEAAANNRDKRLEIVGSGPLQSEIENFISTEDLDNIVLNGYLHGEKLEEKLKWSRFIVLPSTCYENAPLSILEVMRFGKPAIGSRIGGIPEMISEGENGFLFEPGNAMELSEKIGELFDNDRLRLRMGKASRELFLRSYTKEVHMKKIIDIYEESRLR